MTTPGSSSKRKACIELQKDVPAEIKGNIIAVLEDPKDIDNLGRTCSQFNVETRRLRFRELNLRRLLDRPSELGEMKSIGGLIKQLSKSPMEGEPPLSTYVREVKYSEYDKKNIDDDDLIAILKACNYLLKIDIIYSSAKIDWPGIVKPKTGLQHLLLGNSTPYEPRFSFWSLFHTLTTSSLKIKSIVLRPQRFKDGNNYSKDVPHTTSRPCTELGKVLVDDEVWTMPYLKYLSSKAPNLVYAHLGLTYEKRLGELKATLEASLEVWSKTLKELWICYSHDEDDVPELQQRQIIPVTFPQMLKLEKLELIGIQISNTSLCTLHSLTSLSLALIDHKDIVTSLSDSSILRNLIKINVDTPSEYTGVINMRGKVKLTHWRRY